MSTGRINLLPHREQKRAAKKREFVFVAAGTFIFALAGALLIHTILAGMVEAQQNKNKFLKTEIAKVDKEIARPLYRTVGYRVCGERAVRVDILERLADLIRPALSWREGSPVPKPAGAIEGGGFTVTPLSVIWSMVAGRISWCRTGRAPCGRRP